MNKIEKIVLSIIIVCSLILCYIGYNISRQIKESGGIRNVIVETGKEVKGIVNEISEDENK